MMPTKTIKTAILSTYLLLYNMKSKYKIQPNLKISLLRIASKANKNRLKVQVF
jgi:hypothetical protein